MNLPLIIDKPKVLHLTLKKKWFDMILSGEKKEEYRELKLYWRQRLVKGLIATPSKIILHPNGYDYDVNWKDFDIVRFKNGYGNRPWLDIEFKGIKIGTGNPEWGAVEGEEYFVIKLGKILTTSPQSG